MNMGPGDQDSSHLVGDPDREISDPAQERNSRKHRSCSIKKHLAIARFWSKISEYSKVVFRALGLAVIISALKPLRHPFGKGFQEQPKVAVHRNRTTSILRALIHVVPVGVALWEVILNWKTYYVGTIAYNQVYYQLAAKAHEIMIQASLAAVIFSNVRHEMALGEGLPFGALFSGLQINQVSYLWSREFWGSVVSKHLSIRRKVATLAVIILSFVLAAVAGPSSAVLLIPRLDYWPAGSTHIWVNATTSEIWPQQVDGGQVPNYCSVSQESPVSNECPASEWQSIKTFMLLQNSILPWYLQNQTGLSVYPYETQVTGKSSVRQFLMSNMEGPSPLPTSGLNHIATALSTTQQAVIADALANTGAIWGGIVSKGIAGVSNGPPLTDQQNAVHSIRAGYFQPYSCVTCARDVIRDRADQRPLAFPVDPARNYNLESESSFLKNVNVSISGVPAIEYPALTRAELLDLPGLKSDNRVKWVELPQTLFKGSSIGAIILLRQDAIGMNTTNDNTEQDMVICNIDAGWGSSSMNTSFFREAISATSSQVNGYDPQSAKVYKALQNEINQKDALAYYQIVRDSPMAYFPPDYPTVQIGMNEAWVEYLNPFVPSLNTTVIDIILKAIYNHSKPRNPQHASRLILSGLVTNGLARQGFKSQFQGTMKTLPGPNDTAVVDGGFWLSGKGDFFSVDPNESKDWVKLRVESTIEGYAYNTHGTPPKVAIAFLLTYCALALAHIVYSGISGISSTCWDSIAEVTALAVNSTPTTALRNTCAGITELNIFKMPVRILAMSDLEGEGEHLELVFGNIDEKEVEKKSIKVNRKYGTMPSLRKRH